MTRRLPGLLPVLALGTTLGLIAPGLAQNAPLTLPPPGAGASDQTAAKPAKKPARKKKGTEETGLSVPGGAKSGKAADPTFSESAIARPKKFVPAEFDNDDGYGSARPIMTPSGRAGVGMRF
jgi:hypothetical protein